MADITLELNPEEEAAIVSATQRYNAQFGQNLSPAEWVQLQWQQRMRYLIETHRQHLMEAQKNALAQALADPTDGPIIRAILQKYQS